MRKILLLAFFIFAMTSTQSFGQCGNLYIGGVIDGPLAGGTPKGIQLCASGDIADLSIYGIGSANNGGGSDGQEFTFPAEAIFSGDCFWVGANTTGWDAFFGFTPCYVSGSASINGDDAIQLFCSGSFEDLFGDINVDGNGECWEYLDGWAVNNTGGPNFGVFDCADWTFSGPNALDGATSNASAGDPYPSPDQTCPSVLPVAFQSFTAKSRNNAIELSWSTASELNNDYFTIQHSRDGKTFEDIDKVNGYGTSNKEQNYTYTHENPQSGLNYYRLQQNDIDGRFDFSDIVQAENKFNDVKIYPTHINNTINIELKQIETAQLTIFNHMGQMVTNEKLNSQHNTLDISRLPAGAYFAKVESNSQSTIQRIVKF